MTVHDADTAVLSRTKEQRMAAVVPVVRQVPPARILLADDDPVTRHVVGALLSADGHEVTEAATGREALAQFRAVAPDLVLLDVQMPDGDGFEACADLRALDPEEMVPIVMLTARDDLAAVEHTFRLRATDFITKPFQQQLLQQRVRFALRSRGLDREVRRSRERQAVALRMARVIFWDWTPASDVLAWSNALLPVEHGTVEAPTTLHALSALLHEADASRLTGALARAEADGDAFDLELRLTAGRREHVVRVLGGPTMTADGGPAFSGALQDVSAIRRTEALAEHLALHDELTGLGNRRAFTRQLDTMLESLRTRPPAPRRGAGAPDAGGVLLVGWLDISRFQRLNDGLGPHIGNQVLARLGRRLRTLVDAPHLVARMGGDEFAVALRAADPEWARVQFESLLMHLRQPLRYAGGEITLCWSAGYALAPDHGVDAPTVLGAAELAQRAARDSGRMFEVAPLDAARPGRAAALLDRERALRRAVRNKGLRMVVQPQLDARTRQVVGVETLLRWRDEQGREVPPVEFVPLLEESDLIIEVGAWCLEEACRWQEQWRAQGLDLRVAVNLSPRQFADPQLRDRIASAISAHGIPAGRLELELTESLAMQRPDYAADMLQALRALGVLVAIDDFGVGYSSLSRLVRFPIDTIKLDRAFIAELLHSRHVEAVVRAAAAIADGLGLTTIAEGVETHAQADLLRQLGITELQGFLFAYPMPPEELVEFVRASPSRHAPYDR